MLRLVSRQLLFCPIVSEVTTPNQQSFLAPRYPFLDDLKETRNVKVLFFAFWDPRSEISPDPEAISRNGDVARMGLGWITSQSISLGN